MKFTVTIYTVIPDEKARSYGFSVDAESIDQAQIQLSRKFAHDWVEIPDEAGKEVHSTNVRTSYIAAWEITRDEAIEALAA